MGNPLRVLHVVVNMNRGGAETLIMNLYRSTDRAQVQFDFLTCKEGVFDSEIMAMGGRIHRIPYITEVGHTGFIRELNTFFKQNPEYNIIHAHMDKMSGFVLRAAKRASIPIRIAHSHNTRSEGGNISKLYKWYAGSYIQPNATHFYACSQAAAKWLYGSRNKNPFILKNGIVTDKFKFIPSNRDRIRQELNVEQDALVIGHVGRFCKQKNHLFLLEIFAELKQEIPHATILLAGEGPLKEKIMKKIKDLHLEKDVKLLGVREDIDMVLQTFDLFVFPSRHEGLPVTLIEAQASGLPCLVSSAITKEVDMGMGMINFLSLADKGSWVRAIMKLANNRQSRVIKEDALAGNGYDIRKTAGQTQTSYLALARSAI